MDKGYKVIVENWNKFLNEEEKVEEGVMDTVRRIGREFTGALGGAYQLRRKVERLKNLFATDGDFSSTAAEVVTALQAQGVNTDEIEAQIKAYEKKPFNQSAHEELQITLRDLEYKLGRFMAGKKREK